MNRLLIGAAVAAAFTAGSAMAADIPLKAPPPAVSSWAGPYFGVAFGARSNDVDWTTTCLAGCPTAAPIDASSPRSFDSTSFRVGPYIGLNFQLTPTWVAGFEFDGAWAEGKKTTVGIPGCTLGCPGAVATNPDSSFVRTNWDASLRGRLGFLVTPNWLIYGTGGLALLSVDANLQCAQTGPWCGANQNQTSHSLLAGWTAGGGLEWKWSNWLLRGEYRFAEFDNAHPAFFTNRPTDRVDTNIRIRTHTALFGIAYLFGGPAPRY